jgi:hypothetical protein
MSDGNSHRAAPSVIVFPPIGPIYPQLKFAILAYVHRVECFRRAESTCAAAAATAELEGLRIDPSSNSRRCRSDRPTADNFMQFRSLSNETTEYRSAILMMGLANVVGAHAPLRRVWARRAVDPCIPSTRRFGRAAAAESAFHRTRFYLPKASAAIPRARDRSTDRRLLGNSVRIDRNRIESNPAGGCKVRVDRWHDANIRERGKRASGGNENVFHSMKAVGE